MKTTHNLIIAEKPSVARAIASVLGVRNRQDGSYEGNGYIISWCIGHLLGLAEPQDYDSKYVKWRYEDLPIAPGTWKYTAATKTKKQLKILASLLKNPSVGTIINACDAGREGELIFRLVYEQCKCKKPIQRLWISSMEEAAIAEGFRNLRPGTDYDRLYQAALCRQQADWLIGMNYSRLFSILYNAALRVGRVQTPTLAMVVAREEAISKFVKEAYYIVELTGAGFTAEREKLKDKAMAEAICAACNGKIATIKSIKKKDKSIPPQKLHDLTTLQREANRLFGFTASQTLNAAQNLYEKKLITYPRTDSRFLTDDMASGIPSLVRGVATVLPFTVLDEDIAKIKPGQVINNKKVTDHHAIIPTPTTAKANISSLPMDEKNLLMLVCTRLISAVSEKHIFDETIVTVECEGEIFTAKGKVILQNGWKTYEEALVVSIGRTKRGGDKPLPKLYEGQQYTAETSVREGFTQPPKHFTEDLLLSAMEHAGAEDMPNEMERKGLGTPATRASIIEVLVKSGFLIREAKLLLPTEKGVNLIKVLPEKVKSPLLTAEWEHNLKLIERGEQSSSEFMIAINHFVAEMVKTHHTAPDEYKTLFPPETPKKGGKGRKVNKDYKPIGEPIALCPRCGGNVSEAPKGFFCGNRECQFAFFKDSRFFSAKKIELTKEIAKTLITEGRIYMEGLHSEKKGTNYNATILLDDKGTGYPGYQMDFSAVAPKV